MNSRVNQSSLMWHMSFFISWAQRTSQPTPNTHVQLHPHSTLSIPEHVIPSWAWLFFISIIRHDKCLLDFLSRSQQASTHPSLSSQFSSNMMSSCLWNFLSCFLLVLCMMFNECVLIKCENCIWEEEKFNKKVCACVCSRAYVGSMNTHLCAHVCWVYIEVNVWHSSDVFLNY